MSHTFCSYYDQNICKSCELIEESLDEQIKKKEEYLKEILSFMGPLSLEETIRSQEQGFRNKAKWIVTGSTDNPLIGLTGIKNLDEGRELSNCAIVHPRILELTKELPAFISEYKLTPYSILQRRGELKAIIIFYSPYSKQMYLRFVLRSKESLLRIKKLTPILQQKFPDLLCVSANIQPIAQAILEGPEEIFFSNQNFIRHTLPGPKGEIPFKLSPQAFVQTNTLCSVKLYQKAADWISEIKATRMMELFCGQGAFSFFAASSTQKSLGIEINTEAINMANETAHELKLSHLVFKAADVAHIESEIRSYQADLILVNPPRRGLGEAGRKLILQSQVQNFIYSSCSAESLSEDLKSLYPHYRIRKLQIFDMFPHTKHFETLVFLSKT